MTMRKTFAGAVVMGLAFVVGCQTPGYKKAAKTNNSLADVKAELIADKSNLQAAVNHLNDLVYRPASDLRPQYVKFADSVKTLEKSTEASGDSARNMVDNREEYMSKWRADIAQMTDVDLRMRALDRIQSTEQNFVTLGNKLVDANRSIMPLVNDLKAISVYLGNDLTASGIKTITDRATNAKNQSIAVNQKIDDAVMEVDKVSDQIAPMPTTQPVQ